MKALLLALCAGAIVAAQEPAARFSSRVQLVEVYATVTDARGEPVLGLRQSDFAVSEDGTPQTVTTFAAGEFPLSVALLIVSVEVARPECVASCVSV